MMLNKHETLSYLANARPWVHSDTVKLIDQVRRDNIERLQKECGSLKQLAKVLARDESQVSQWKNGSKNSGSGRQRGMRSETARYIEEQCGKPLGWLDADHGAEPIMLVMPSSVSNLMSGQLHDVEDSYFNAPLRAWEYENALPEAATSVFIPQMEVSFSKDSNASQANISFVTSHAQIFGADWIVTDQLKPSQLGYLEVSDNSMFPTLERGDRVVVDRSQQQVVDAGTFAIAYGRELRIRRLFRLPSGGLRIEADNKDRYPTIELDAQAAAGVEVMGRCVRRTGRGSL